MKYYIADALLVLVGYYSGFFFWASLPTETKSTTHNTAWMDFGKQYVCLRPQKLHRTAKAVHMYHYHMQQLLEYSMCAEGVSKG